MDKTKKGKTRMGTSMKKGRDKKLVEFLKAGGRKGAAGDFNRIVKRASTPRKGGKSGN